MTASDPPTGLNPSLTMVVLALAGAGLNLLPVPLGYGLDLLPGLVAAYLALFLHGRFAGVFVAIACVVPTVWLWGNPYAGAVIVAEVLFVAWLSGGRWRLNPLAGIVLFWASAGWLAWWVLSATLMHMDRVSVALIVIKQASNGFLAAAVAMLILVLLPARSRIRPRGVFADSLRSLQALLIAVFAVFTLVPFLASVYLTGKAYRDDVREQVSESLAHSLDMVISQLDATSDYEFAQLRALAANVEPIWAPAGPAAGHAESIAGVRLPDSGVYRGDEASTSPGSAPFRALLAEVLQGPDTQRVVPLRHDIDGSPGFVLAFFARVPSELDEPIVAYRVYPLSWVAERLRHLPISSGISMSLAVEDSVVRLRDGVWKDPEAVPSEVLHKSMQDIDYILQMADAPPGPSAMHEWALGTAWSAGKAEVIPGLRVVAALDLAPVVAAYRERLLTRLAGLSFVALLALMAGVVISKAMTRSLSRSMNAIRVMGQNLAAVPRDVSRLQEPDALNRALYDLSGQLRQQQQRLEQHNQRLERMVHKAPVVLWTGELDPEKNLRATFISRSVRQLAGVDEVPDFTAWFNLIDAADRMQAMQMFDALFEKGYAAGELRIRRPDGERVWIYSETTLLPVQHGEAQEVVGIWVDISEIKQNQRNLVHTAKMASVGELVTGVAHELNQPLQVIQLAADNARDVLTEPLDEDAVTILRGRLERIAFQAERASSIVDRMRIFGRRESDDAVDFSLSEVVDAVVGLMGSQVRSRGIALHCKHEGVVRGHGQRQAMEQVLINLLINARDAVEQQGDGGERWIRITTRITDGPASTGPQCQLEVADSGGGIPDVLFDRVFEPFFTTKPVGEGTGLGLSISYGLMRDMAGGLSARNGEQGAIMTASLPVAAGAKPGV